MKIDNYSEKNREAWNEAAGVHKKNRKVDYTVLFKNKNYSVLDSTLSSLLNKISLSGRAVAQLCCNNGRELLSIVKLQVRRVLVLISQMSLLQRQAQLLNLPILIVDS